MKNLCKLIQNTIENHPDIECSYEIEYMHEDDSCNDWIDIRLICGAAYETEALTWALLMTPEINKYANHIGAEVPQAHEIKYGFGGIHFERVFVELPDGVDLNTNGECLITGDSALLKKIFL